MRRRTGGMCRAGGKGELDRVYRETRGVPTVPIIPTIGVSAYRRCREARSADRTGSAPALLNPEAYLTDTLAKIAAGHPISRISELMPWAFQSPPSDTAA